MNNLRCTIYDVRCTILKFIILFIFSISVAFHSFSQENKIVTDTISVNKTVLADSIPFDDTFHNPFLKQYKYGITSGDLKKSTLPSTGKIKKQKKIDTTHYSPKKAAIWGAAFPGLGQVYNKKYWKLPIVYGIMGTVIYFVAANAKKLRTFNGYIRNVYDSVPNPFPYDQLELDQIETYRNTYRKNVQLASFGTVIAWGLSIVDAVVDAHLRHFDVSDKLALRVKPELNYSNFTYYAGIGLNLRFK